MCLHQVVIVVLAFAGWRRLFDPLRLGRRLFIRRPHPPNKTRPIHSAGAHEFEKEVEVGA